MSYLIIHNSIIIDNLIIDNCMIATPKLDRETIARTSNNDFVIGQ